MSYIEGLVVAKCDHVRIFNNFSDLSLINVSEDFIHAVVQSVAIGEHVFEP